MLPIQGALGRTPIESSDAPAPIAAVTGSGDALVAMVLPGPAVSVASATEDIALPRTLDAWSFGAAAPDALRPFGIVSLAPAGTPFAVTPLRALDPELRADLLLAAFATGGAPSSDDTPATVAAQGQATVGARTTATATAATATADKKTKKKSTKRPPLYKKLWRKPPGSWKVSQKVTWYGPGFYGNRTACGQKYTRYIIGVAHRTLPCGTLVQFTWRGMTAVAPVIDRGPYGHRTLKFDWSAWLSCRVFRPKGVANACFTRSDVKYRVVGKVNLEKWFKDKKAQKRKRQG